MSYRHATAALLRPKPRESALPEPEVEDFLCKLCGSKASFGRGGAWYCELCWGEFHSRMDEEES